MNISILANIYARVSSCHQPRHAKASILIEHFYTIMSCCQSSNHTVNSYADTLPFVKNKKTHKIVPSCSKFVLHNSKDPPPILEVQQ